MSADDSAYNSDADDSGGEGGDSNSELEVIVDGEELAGTLSAKTNPKAGKTRSKDTGNASGKGKGKAKESQPKRPTKKARKAPEAPIDVDDSESETVPENQRKTRKPRGRAKISAIWRFFKEVDVANPDPTLKYLKCNLGSRAVIELTRTSNGNVLPLKNHLKNNFAQHYRMFLLWSTDQSLVPTQEELKIAEGKQDMTAQVARKFQDGLAKVEGNIVTLMNKHAENAKEPWNQSHFEELLAKWIAATDQPFSVVEEPEFKTLLRYPYWVFLPSIARIILLKHSQSGKTLG
ncbi:hypothetical protein C8R46DRAFT_1046247 [Mycena filopes]|nr:hypothetical protein C8R46DRAFT_1046247 [Mycena filopes]